MGRGEEFMNKLTAEVARQDLNYLKAWVETCGISMKEERYMQALEIALPILEQQERGEGDWIEWKGVGRPTSTPYQIVEYRTRLGNVSESAAGDLRWNHEGKGGDIIAYRIIPEHPTNQNGEQ
jgi:hypothetical protein